MFVHEDLVTIVFRLTSFGIFIFFCVCLFKRYLRSFILGMMQYEHDELQKIKDRHKELEKQERFLEAATQEQADRIRLLKERIAHWHYVEQIAVQKRTQERERWLMIHNERITRQGQLCAQEALLHTMVPNVINKVEHDLRTQYASVEANQQYIAVLLERQKRGEL